MKELSLNSLLLLSIIVCNYSNAEIFQDAYVKASNTGVFDSFGYSIAISDNTMVVGVPFEQSNATGVNGDEENDLASRSGAVYVYVMENGQWLQQAYLKASNTEANDFFGWDVAISADTIVVGAYQEDSNATGVDGDETNSEAFNSGAAYVFVRTGDVWSQQAYLKAPFEQDSMNFGYSVTLFANTIAIGAKSSHVTVEDADFNNTGAVFLFKRNNDSWSFTEMINASSPEISDNFGYSVALDGNNLLIGAPEEDSSTTGINGDENDNSESRAGAAYLFTRDNDIWTQQAYIKASNTDSNDYFGNAVAISDNTLVVSAFREDGSSFGINFNQNANNLMDAGAVYVFTMQAEDVIQQAYIKASNPGLQDRFGHSIAFLNNTLVVGSLFEDGSATGINGNQNSLKLTRAGAAYLFCRTGTMWEQSAYIKASNPGLHDQFGNDVAVSSKNIVIGSHYEDSNATGVNGDQSNEDGFDSGAVYIIDLDDLIFKNGF